MPYKRYGEIFKKLREQKNFSLSHFSEIGISKASLSRFELGQTMISFERLDSALQEMNVTLAEYEHFINNFSMDYKEDFLEDIILADIADDVDKFHNLYLEAMEYDSKMLAYCAKSRYEILTQMEADDVVEYLYDVGEWGYFELSIFYLTLDSFSEREIMYLMKELWGKSKHLYGVFKYRRRVLQSSYRAVVLLSSKGARDSARSILQKSYPKDDFYDLYVENLRNLAHGFYSYCFKDKISGEKQIKNAIEIFGQVGYEDLADYYQKRYQKLLEKLLT